MASVRYPIQELLMGANELPWTTEEVSDWLSDKYVKNTADEERRRGAHLRDLFYKDDGDAEMEDFIASIFDDKDVREERLRFVRIAKHNNSLKRIVDEKSTVYQQNAVRKSTSQDTYDELQRLCYQDQAFRRGSKMLNLHNDVLLQFRVRDEGFRRKPIIDVITPAKFFAVAHPDDPSHLVAIGFEQARADAKSADPHWLLWTHRESVHLDGNGRVMWGTHKEHHSGMHRMPMLLVHSVRPEHRNCLLDGTSGDDLIAGYQGVWFQNILAAKESKSVNNQAAFTGDLSDTPRGQSQDTGRDLQLGEGVTVQTINRGTDLRQFRDGADHVEERTAGNHGVAPTVLRHDGATSGFEITLRLLPIKQIREAQVPVWRDAERDFAEIQSMVLALDEPSLLFGEYQSVDFGEVQAPMDPMKRVEVFEKERAACLTDTVEETMSRNPDLDAAAAQKEIELHVDREVVRVQLQQDLQRMDAGMNTSPGEPLPEQFGELRVVGDEDADEQ